MGFLVLDILVFLFSLLGGVLRWAFFTLFGSSKKLKNYGKDSVANIIVSISLLMAILQILQNI